MTWLTNTLRKLGESLPLNVLRALVKRDFVVINYHIVTDQKPPHVAHLFPYKTPVMFEQDLKYLQKNFNLVSYDQLVDHLSGNRKLPPKSVLLTFDDGFTECYEVVCPLLKKYSAPSTFFVSTNSIDNKELVNPQKVSLFVDKIMQRDEKEIQEINQALRATFGYTSLGKQDLITLLKSSGIHNKALIERLGEMLNLNFDEYLTEHTPYLTTAQIQAMNNEGFTIGSHGLNHTKFSDLTDDQIEGSLVDSCLEISKVTGKRPVPFAFPHNADGVSRELLSNLLAKHPHIGLLFDANGIHNEKSFLISRLNGDRLGFENKAKSNLALNIKRAYLEEIIGQIN